MIEKILSMIKKQGKRLSLRTRMIILVSLEIMASIGLAFFVSNIVNEIFGENMKIPLLVELLVLSLIIGAFVTSFISKVFFDPIKKLCDAMEKVAGGDYKVRLATKSSSGEIQELYSDFNLMTKELDATEILQSDFVSSVSHEFKTPINAIEGYATLLQDCDNLTHEQQQYVYKINYNTKRLSSLVGNILLLSKIENQSIQTNKTCFRLDEQIRQSIVMLEPEWEKKNISFDVEMEPVNYTGSEFLLYHVWDNLIGNAIKFDPQDGIIIIRLNRIEDVIYFTVEDNGTGIPDEALKHIFDKFYQADSSHKSQGNGLGLALAKRIVTLSGGEILAENISHGGSRFTVILR